MCELFGMSSRFPADVNFSMEKFAQHGGCSGPHKDGWGVAYYEEEDVQVFRESTGACHSELLGFVMNHKLNSRIVLSHIRRATHGSVSLPNTQPFCRELCGRMHVFAHNGDIPEFRFDTEVGRPIYQPVGSTDSERAFCTLMNDMDGLWHTASGDPPLRARCRRFAEFARQARLYGPANFVYSDAEFLYVHAHQRTQKDGTIHQPGLYMLSRKCEYHTPVLETAGLRISSSAPCQQVILFASVPLTDEEWIPLREAEIVVASGGKQIYSSVDRHLKPVSLNT